MSVEATDPTSAVPQRSEVARLLVVMPALNEEGSVARVIADVMREQPDASILVVDDGSTDCTAERARAAGAMVMSLPFNLGVGGAMRAAYRYAADHGFDKVVQVDADGQHDPADIAVLIDAAGGTDVVIGARFAGRGDYVVKGPRKWAMKLLSSMLTTMTGTRITDPTSGFRLAQGRAVALFARHYPEEYLGDTVEALVIAHRCGLVIRQVPVAMRPRQAGEASQNALRAAIYLMRVITAVGLALLRRPPQISADPLSQR
ncbi:glycosyltransferase family 2 protein [Pseudonocardia bannensis]|uniref:Glycosyltransferase family 2 protein n=1 Tax=Pseudonocardia bannensis TaxID=630973 RepID=A0A848DA78_9PSEU|nr:glycosyltransferase family 2 protein [Pseudonocardia bannensis]NMH90143.1 glycosyltransferase family 2 protein [Pseudonocardia bannensis]